MILQTLAGALIVSCQPVSGGPMDRPDIVAAFALAAGNGGAKGLRIEGVANVRAVRAVTRLPIIGLLKRASPDTPVIITATGADVNALAEAGADIIAFDATDRTPRPETVESLTRTAHGLGRLAMADVALFADAQLAARAGVDVVGTTLSGYTGGAIPDGPDIVLVGRCAALGVPVFAEGRYHTPAQARRARQAGAHAVVVGSAITRPEHVAAWFVDALGSVPASAPGESG